MKKIRFIWMVLLIPSLIMVSCKKDEENKVPIYKQPTAASRGDVVTIPDGLQARSDAGDINSLIAVSYMGLANAISNFSSNFIIPEGAQIQGKKSGSTVYYWTYQGYSYWMTYTELADKYTWEYDWEVPGQARFTYISAEELKTGKSGSWTIYNSESTSDFVWTYGWSINTSETFTANLVWNEGGTEESSFNVVSKADNSGSFKYYIATVLNAEILWNTDGSGTYTFFGEGGNQTGSWTAK